MTDPISALMSDRGVILYSGQAARARAVEICDMLQALLEPVYGDRRPKRLVGRMLKTEMELRYSEAELREIDPPGGARYHAHHGSSAAIPLALLRAEVHTLKAIRASLKLLDLRFPLAPGEPKPQPPPAATERAVCRECGKRAAWQEGFCKRCCPDDLRPHGKIT